MDIMVICPANCATGGPEALHEFASNLNRIDSVNARLWYWNIQSSDPMPEEYKRYGCDYVTDLPQNYSGVLVAPEIWANRVMDYPNCTKAIWWLGVDAYANWTPIEERGAFLKDDSIIHIAQSEYAFDFLKRLKVKRLYKCTDLVNADFYEPYPEMERGNEVLFNPAKATPFMQHVINECSDVTFWPIKGMTRAEVIEAMRGSKLYVDFGEFPGRERMPREAALCGCCLITSKIGAAAYREDFAHDYKFDSKTSHLWAIADRIHYVLDHYDECREDFAALRKQLCDDVTRLNEQYQQIMEVFNEV